MTKYGYPLWRYLRMNKIICDVCGTSYQESAECCPICGCTRDEALLLGEEFAMEDLSYRSGNHGGQQRKKEIFDFDEVNSEPSRHDRIEEVRYDEEEPVAVPRRHNTFAVIVLTVLIAVFLLLGSFLFLRYFLPGTAEEETIATTAPQVLETQAAPVERVTPCQSLALTSGTPNLTTEGAFFLINVSVYPEDTTDPLYYHSADSSIATVDESGRITAVAEGSTLVYITCGTQQISCEVVCDFTPETVATTAQTVSEETEAAEVAEVAEEPVQEETVAETAAEPAADPAIKNVVLKLKKTDIILDVGYYFTLQLDCELEPEEVEWSSAHPWVAKVDEKGVVTALDEATTIITAKYGDQEVTCTVRCR